MNTFRNPAETMFDAVDFFDRVDRKNGGDGIVWVKAVAPRGRQVITELLTSQGRRVKIPAIRPGDPICISKYASFDIIRESSDFLQAVNSGIMKLMTHKEANAYFQKKASLLKTSPQELINKAEQSARDEFSNRQKQNNDVDVSQRVVTPSVATEDVVNPRLHHLCAQVQPRLAENEKMPVKELMSEVLDLEDSLTLDDLAYLQANGFYPTVKKWAESKYLEVARAQGLVPESDDLSD